MDARQVILDVLKGSTSQNPMGFDELHSRSELLDTTLNLVLDGMLNQLPALVNRALISRRGKSPQHYYWPTGVVETARRVDIVINPRKAQRPPRFPTQTNTSPAAAQKGDEMKTEKKISNVDVVKHVISNPGMTNIEMLELFAGSDPAARNRITVMISNCLTNNYLKRLEDKSLVVGDNEIWLAQHDLLPKKESKPGSTAAAAATAASETGADSSAVLIQAHQESMSSWSGESKAEEPAAQPSSLVDLHLKMHHPEAVAEIEIPAFLRKRDETASAVTLSDPEISYEEIQAQKLVDKPAQFRLAVSSDRTLTIYGKTAQPIELDTKETEELLDFMDGISMLFPAL